MSEQSAENALPPNPRCGGIFVNGKTPKCCETHVLPWGHDRTLLGILAGSVAPDTHVISPAEPAANRCGWDLCGDPDHRPIPPTECHGCARKDYHVCTRVNSPGSGVDR